MAEQPTARRRPGDRRVVADPIFAHPRLAPIYDDLDADRRDLDHYETIVEEFDARTVLDVGCGTGSLACRLARRGIDVTAVDPAAASLDVARRKHGAAAVRWIQGSALDLPSMAVDLAMMTGNVAQVLLTEPEFGATLRAIRAALRPGGRVVFEVRDPAFRGWQEWTRDASWSVRPTRSGPVESWVELVTVDLPMVSFRWTYRFLDDGAVVTSDSTLVFRSREEIITALGASGLRVDDVRDAPDRPHREFVFVATRVDR